MKESLLNDDNVMIGDEKKRFNKDNKKNLDMLVTNSYSHDVAITQIY